MLEMNARRSINGITDPDPVQFASWAQESMAGLS